MKRQIIIILLFSGVLSIYSQELLTVRYFDLDWIPCDSIIAKYKREIYQNKDETFTFKDYFINKGLQMVGNYKSFSPLIEDGKFEFYYENGNLNFAGNYCEGNLCGTWILYSEDGTLNKVINYDYEKPKCPDKIKHNTLKIPNPDSKGDADSLPLVEIMPLFNGQDYTAFKDYLRDNLVFPLHALKVRKRDKILVSFEIDIDGKICNAAVLNNPYKDFKKEALRVLNNSPDWVPAYYRDEPVRVFFTIPITFGEN